MLDASGSAIDEATLVWASSDPKVATVERSRGIVHGVGPGGARITVRTGTVVAGVVVTVLPRPADSTMAASADASRGRGSARPPDGTGTAPNAAAAPASSVAPAPASEAQLRNDVQTVLAAYAHAIEMRDTTLIRRVFPNAGYELLTRWQTTFDDARGPISMSDAAVEILDPLRDSPGAQVRVRARYSARFSSRAARSDQSFPVSFTAVLQRDAGAWRIAAIR